MRTARFFLSALLLLPFTAQAADSVIIFDELHYHPADEVAQTEWIELRSLQGVDVDISGWRLEGGVDFTFPPGTVMAGGSYLVVAKVPGQIPGALAPFTGQLDNGGEEIRLVNLSDRTMDVLDYSDDGDWPAGADGGGATLARRNGLSADSGPRSWAASNELGGTPGTANFLDAASTPKLTTPAPISASWKYNVSNVALPANWKDAAFNDSAWAAGPGLLYAGTAKIAEPQAPTVVLSNPGANLTGWWAFQETSGTTAFNSAAGGTNGTLIGVDATFVADATRGRVIRLNINGSNQNTATSYVTAGTLPVMTLENNFTWSFWSKTTTAAGTNVVLGNRYRPGGGDFNPREFIKFTGLSFEWHRNTAPEDIDYADMAGSTAAPGPWIHHVVTKQGATLTYYRNGVASGSRTITAAPINPQPIFFGADGNAGVQEAWSGYLDDVATWTKTLPAQAIAGLFSGTYTPATAPTDATVTSGGPGPIPAAIQFPVTTSTVLTDDFAAPAVDGAKWSVVNLGLESTTDGGYAAPAANGQLTLGGTTNFNYWAGKSLQSVQRFSTRERFTVNVDRGSLAGTGTAYRSSLWLYADAGHYLHFSQNQNEGGWSYNSNDVNGSGVNNPTGAGVNLGAFDGVDADLGTCQMRLVFIPGTFPGSGTIEMYRNGVLGGTQTFSNWPADFAVVLTGQARQAVDTVTAVFDNLEVIKTVAVPLQTNTGSIPSTAYFRHAFTFGGDPTRSTLSMYPILDDGAVFYLNGQEVYRQNMPGGAPAHGTAASQEVVDGFFPQTPVPIPTTNLVRGTNVLAVEVHQFSPNGGDLLFGAQLQASEVPAPPVDTAPTLVLNEVSAVTDATFRVELANLSGTAINLADYQLRGSAGPGYTLSGTLNPGQLIVLDHTQLGFRPGDGDRLFLVNTTAQLLADARVATNALRGRTGNGTWGHPNSATFGTANTFITHDEIVINEVMYHAPGTSQEQWIELYNKSGAPVNLSGWHFTDGVSFTFPPATTLGPGQYALVVWDVAAFNALHPGLPNVYGPLSQNLSGRGERVRLRDASDNLADEVEYLTGGRWPEFPDGGGSSLELKNPRMDNASAESWAASDEIAKGTWKDVNYTFSGANLEGNPTYYNELVVGMVAAGEAFIDDLHVVELPGTELLGNGDFSSGTAATWRFVGNHRTSTVVDDPSSPGNKVLKIAATGYTEHMSNHCETTLRSGATLPWTINPAATYRISYRARWAGGSNRLHTRLYFNRGARQELLPMPATGGTPGAQNSRFTANAGPTFSALAHNPAVPPVSQPATVSVRATDPDGVSTATLFYSLNEAAFVSLPMTLSNGVYTATIPGQAAGAKVQFYVQAQDTLGAIATFPAAGAASRALIPWNDSQAQLTLPSGARPHNVRIVMTTTDTNTLHAANNVMSNEYKPCTVIYDERDIYYNVGVHLKGSEHGRAKDVRVGFHLQFGPDQLFLGQHGDVAIDRSGAGDQYSQKEILLKRSLNTASNIYCTEDDLCRVIAPRTQHTDPAILIKAKLDSREFLDGQLENGGDGTMFEYELTYPLYNSNGIASSTDNGTVEGFKLTQDSPGPPGVGVRALSPGLSKEEYRWFWLIKNNRNADNYAPLITALTALGQNGATFITQTNATLDVDGWLRSFAGAVAWSVGDNYAFGSAHNALLYVKPDGRTLYVPWDMDFTASSGATAGIVPNNELSKFVNNDAGNRRAYYGHLLDVCNRSFNTTYLTYWAQHYSKFLTSKFGTEDLSSFLPFISQREAYIRTQVNAAIPSVGFTITTNGGAPFTVAANSTNLAGTGWVNIREFRRADTGAVLPATWTGNTTWQLSVALNPGVNPIALQAYDYAGALIGTVNITITNTLTPPQPRDWLRITEVHYHPADPSTAGELAASTDADDFEFIELRNFASQTLDISRCEFTTGVDFLFANGTTLAPGEYIHVVRHVAGFVARYSAGPRVAGAYGPADSLSNGGETLTLLDATGAVIQSFAYGDSLPWPANADGAGYSLVPIAPNLPLDRNLPGNWRASSIVGGGPNASDATTFSGTPTNDLDGDKLNAFLEYALGTSEATPNTGIITAVAEPNGKLLVTLTRALNADDVACTLEATTNPAGTWAPATAELVASTQLGTRVTESWRVTPPVGATRIFVRLKATAR